MDADEREYCCAGFINNSKRGKTTMPQAQKRIHKVTVKRIADYDGDTSCYGEYSNTATSKFSINRAHDFDCPSQRYNEFTSCHCSGGDMLRNEYHYFNPSFNYIDKHGKALPENTPEEVRKYVRQDYKRMEDLNKGYWSFLGIRAEAQVVINGLIQEITSGGLWGIESDSDKSYFEEIAQEELGQLKDQLKALGFNSRTISAAFKNVEHKEE